MNVYIPINYFNHAKQYCIIICMFNSNFIMYFDRRKKNLYVKVYLNNDGIPYHVFISSLFIFQNVLIVSKIEYYLSVM